MIDQNFGKCLNTSAKAIKAIDFFLNYLQFKEAIVENILYKQDQTND